MNIRPAMISDTIAMSEILNEIIAIGGTTAFLDPVSPETLREWMTSDPENSSWFVAEATDGQIMGYQSADRFEVPSPDALSIATFARVGTTKSGIGTALFEATKALARERGFAWINATIRSDNIGGLRYYDSRGFKTYLTDPNATLSDGTITGKISKRFDL